MNLQLLIVNYCDNIKLRFLPRPAEKRTLRRTALLGSFKTGIAAGPDDHVTKRTDRRDSISSAWHESHTSSYTCFRDRFLLDTNCHFYSIQIDGFGELFPGPPDAESQPSALTF